MFTAANMPLDAVHHSPNFDFLFSKVDNEAKLFTRCLQIVLALCKVNISYHFDCFQFEDDIIINNHISIVLTNNLCFVMNLNFLLGLNIQTKRCKFNRQRILIDIFKKAASKRKLASASRQALLKKLRADLKETKSTLRGARQAAKQEIQLAKAAAKAEIDLLNERLKNALKRENALLKLGEQKAKMMLSAGQRWEKQQLAKIRNLAGKATAKSKK